MERVTERLRGRGWVGLLILALAALAVANLVTEAPAARPATQGRVNRVYDGDTIEVQRVGKVRMIGIDAFDGYAEERTRQQAARYGMPLQAVQRWAERAQEFAREKLDGRAVTLHYGAEATDDYGRTLAYVHFTPEEEGVPLDFNLLMLQRGLAVAYRRFDHPRRADYLAAERAARRRHAGLWKDARIHP